MCHGHREISTGQRRTLYWPVCTSMACKYHAPCLGDCLRSSWFKCETESCYRSPHLFLPLFPCGEKQQFQKTVQWQVKAHNFMPLLCFNTNSASVESERLRQRIQSCTWAALTTDNDAIEPNFFSDPRRDLHRNNTEPGKYKFRGVNIYQVHTMSVCVPDKEYELDEDQKKCLNTAMTKEEETCVIGNWIFLRAGEEDICRRISF